MHTKTVLLLVFLFIITVHAQAQVPPGRLVVYSTPSNANVCIDNAQCDTTTAAFTVTGNDWHYVTITERGYLRYTDSVYVTSNQPSVVAAVLQQDPALTGIQVRVSPGGGTVCVESGSCQTDTSRTGAIQFTGLSEGYHAVTVQDTKNYQDYSKEVYVTTGIFALVGVDLKPAAAPDGTIRVYVNPTGSTVCLDNRDCRTNVGGTAGPGKGFVDFTGVIANTPHTISVGEDGYGPYATQVLVSPGLTSTVNVTLPLIPVTTPVPTTLPPSPTQVPTRAGLDMVPVIGALIVCGAFVLSRRGRR